ncbi:vWA domain-containing protein [Pseudothermotoga sp.]|nr:VWA-like domain-containing protein [Pseudothermotoga sp.]MCX7812601.1 VWA-like domain-containing protein [Pseudothermotoga sp.]MDW8138880.1 VWA-like domain-containing protein [Pseudothermotoga sp.]
MDKILAKLAKRSPFYMYLFLNMSRRPSLEAEKLYISLKNGKFTVVYNPRWVEQKPEQFVEAFLIHQLMHLINLHFLIKPKDDRDRAIWDLAMDAAINQHIPELAAFGVPLNLLVEEGHGVDNENLFVLPPDWMPNKSAEEYHEWIVQEMEKLGRFDVVVVAKMRENRFDSHSEMFAEHDTDMILELSQSLISKAFNLYGSELPSGVRRMVELSILRPFLNWKDTLRRFAGVSEYGERYLTPLKPNRRYQDQPGWKVANAARLGIIVDTSGSIIQEELDVFFTEIESLSRYVDTTLILVQVDRAVNLKVNYTRGMWRNMQIIGGGETDLQPAVDYLEHNHRPEGIVIFTDGFADLPKVKRRVLFILSKYHNDEFITQARNTYGRSSVVVLSW